MTSCQENRRRVLILPHWRLEGGAGFYIQNVIAALEEVELVQIGGVHRRSYHGSLLTSRGMDTISSLSFPIYEGVSISSTILNAFRSLINLFLFFISRTYRQTMRLDEVPDLIILTSSIQAPAIPVLRKFFPGASIAIIIQENIRLDVALGRIMLKLLKGADKVISISNAWSDHATQAGLCTALLRNGYEYNYANFLHDGSGQEMSSVLYVGGSSKIKGFEILMLAAPQLLLRPNLKIICLGLYSSGAQEALESLNASAHPTSTLNVIGHVEDIRPYLKGALVVLLPIKSPHFCRPAIEAGLLQKTFVISKLTGLEDFANDGLNCLAFQSDNISDLVSKVTLLIDDGKLRARLEDANYLNSRLFLQSPSDIIGVFAQILPENNSAAECRTDAIHDM